MVAMMEPRPLRSVPAGGSQVTPEQAARIRERLHDYCETARRRVSASMLRQEMAALELFLRQIPAEERVQSLAEDAAWSSRSGPDASGRAPEGYAEDAAFVERLVRLLDREGQRERREAAEDAFWRRRGYMTPRVLGQRFRYLAWAKTQLRILPPVRQVFERCVIERATEEQVAEELGYSSRQVRRLKREGREHVTLVLMWCRGELPGPEGE
jgi:hypothetical protein